MALGLLSAQVQLSARPMRLAVQVDKEVLSNLVRSHRKRGRKTGPAMDQAATMSVMAANDSA